jgi:Arc/MetJ-type ribon-helix-helix transcriptional regulator
LEIAVKKREVKNMTDMKRTTVSLPDELVEALAELKKTDEFKNVSYSELIRAMIQRGLDKASAGDVA